MSYHGLLDWRLGLALIKVLIDPDFQCGLDKNFNYRYLSNWLDMAKALQEEFCSYFSGCESREYGALRGFVVGELNVIIIHPLWDTRSPSGLLAETIAGFKQGEKYICLDTFNMQRRPSRAYESLAD